MVLIFILPSSLSLPSIVMDIGSFRSFPFQGGSEQSSCDLFTRIQLLCCLWWWTHCTHFFNPADLTCLFLPGSYPCFMSFPSHRIKKTTFVIHLSLTHHQVSQLVLTADHFHNLFKLYDKTGDCRGQSVFYFVWQKIFLLWPLAQVQTLVMIAQMILCALCVFLCHSDRAQSNT